MKQMKEDRLGLLTTFLGLLLLNIFATAALAEPPGGPGATPSPPTVKDLCAKAAPDAEYFIPESFQKKLVASSSGAYGYRTLPDCPLWVVDFSMNSKSNTYVHPRTNQRVKERTLFLGVAHDLPSSASAGGRMPTVAEDCKRFTVEYIVYSKFKHEANFVLRKHVTGKGGGLSSDSPCNLTTIPSDTFPWFETEAPDANVWVIRVATRVKLRSSWQEAAAVAEDAPIP